MKIKMMSIRYNSFAGSHKVKLNTTKIYANDNNARFTHRRYWCERHESGMYRINYASYDSRLKTWCKPRLGKLFLFCAVGFTKYDEPIKVYVTDTLHYTYIEGYLKDYEWDATQTKKLEELRDASKQVYKYA